MSWTVCPPIRWQLLSRCQWAAEAPARWKLPVMEDLDTRWIKAWTGPCREKGNDVRLLWANYLFQSESTAGLWSLVPNGTSKLKFSLQRVSNRSSFISLNAHKQNTPRWFTPSPDNDSQAGVHPCTLQEMTGHMTTQAHTSHTMLMVASVQKAFVTMKGPPKAQDQLPSIFMGVSENGAHPQKCNLKGNIWEHDFKAYHILRQNLALSM